MISAEEELLQRAQKLDRTALAVLYDEYSPAIFRYALIQLLDADLAEDCVSSTFSRLLEAFTKGKGPTDSVRAYLYRVAHNWIIDQYRSRRITEVEMNDDLVSAQDDPVGSVQAKDEQDRLHKALVQLPIQQRQVVFLRFVEELDLNEVARAVKKPVGAVKALQHRGLNNLRKCLSDMEQETSW